jgi:nitroimidazol reductase NimA-like FMN-containing flavoprotein (pyridoxamine 5'-phosphate oxidase superfamily)
VTGTGDHVDTPRSHELTPQECAAYLASATMGRVAWDTGGLVNILPVSYAMHGDRVTFRTSPYGALAHLRNPTNVAFQIDKVDANTSTAWSVVVRGRAEAVVLQQSLNALWARPDIVAWAPGTRNLFISITPQAITGRLVHAPFAT